MKNFLKITIVSSLCFGFLTSSYADGVNNLLLTDSEVQKLKKYFPADDAHLVWKGDPITIILPVGKEKRVVFQSSFSVDAKGALTTDQLKWIDNDKSLYLTALRPFDKTRIYVTMQETGKVVLVDLVTNEQASASTQYVDTQGINTQQNANKNSPVVSTTTLEDGVDEQNPSSYGEDSYVDLIRFAWQQLYAPERILNRESYHYPRTAMKTDKFVTNLIYGDKVISHPLGSWMANNHYVTAVELRNKYTHATSIDLRKDLCGEWQAAVLYPRSYLTSYGNKQSDSTTLFLVSNRPFVETIGVCNGNA